MPICFLFPELFVRLVLKVPDKYLFLSQEYNIEIRNIVMFKLSFEELLFSKIRLL
jgi:hypothetical protein